MKKNYYLIFPIILLILLIGCAGYEPIFNPTNLKFEIRDYTIQGDKISGKKIYSKLYNLSKSNKDKEKIRNIAILINITKQKESTSKSSAGKILEYKITLSTDIKVTDFITQDLLLNENAVYSQSYKVQDKIFETIKIENKSIDDLINKIYHDLLIKLSQSLQ